VKIDKPFYMGLVEIRNDQYAAFDTNSSYRPYPYDEHDGRNAPNSVEMKTVRGGSWYDRPIRARSAARLPYCPWQAVYNVGFRVVMLAE
jgi:formylglycine-generating enzyme required for sulfatase activity